MVNSVVYGIIHSIAALSIYTTIVVKGYRKSAKDDKRLREHLSGLKEIIDDLKLIANKEEDGNMLDNKSGYKSINNSEAIQVNALYSYADENEVVNNNTLGNLLTNAPTEENYNEIMDLLTEVARKTYEEYKFFIARSPDETEQPNFIQIVSHSSEMPELHKKIFAKSIDYGINMPELQERFSHRIARNKVINLGEDVIVITNDGSGSNPTGVSPINSGLEGGEIAFIITFLRKENLEAWEKNTFPEPKDESIE